MGAAFGAVRNGEVAKANQLNGLALGQGAEQWLECAPSCDSRRASRICARLSRSMKSARAPGEGPVGAAKTGG
jgi:hypothetical protein